MGLTKDANGNWICRFWTAGRGSRRVYENLGQITKTEAKKREAELKQEMQGSAAERPNITFAALADTWVKVHVKTLSKGSQKLYRATIKQLRRTFGNQKVRTIRAVQVDEFLLAREEAGRSSSTRRRELAVLVAILNFGDRKGIVKSPLPKEAVTRPEEGVRRTPMEPEEWAQFDRVADGHASQPLWRFMLFAACRISDACALSWRDVDFRAGEVRIYQPKTDRVKVLRIDADLEAILRSVPQGIGDAPVFRNTTGGRWKVDWARDRFNWIRNRARLRPMLTPHSLRKAAATLLYREGVGRDRILGILGDKSPDVLDHYLFERPEDYADAQAILGKALRRGRTVDETAADDASSSSVHSTFTAGSR